MGIALATEKPTTETRRHGGHGVSKVLPVLGAVEGIPRMAEWQGVLRAEKPTTENMENTEHGEKQFAADERGRTQDLGMQNLDFVKP